MTRKSIDERGAELVQLAFAMPLLLFAFIASAQVMIWSMGAVQFATAAESAAYQVDIDEISKTGAGTPAARALMEREISSRMLGTDSNAVTVTDVAVVSDTKGKTQRSEGLQTPSSLSSYFTTTATGRLTFTAQYVCPSLTSVLEPLVIKHTWTRDRLISRRAEVE